MNRLAKRHAGLIGGDANTYGQRNLQAAPAGDWLGGKRNANRLADFGGALAPGAAQQQRELPASEARPIVRRSRGGGDDAVGRLQDHLRDLVTVLALKGFQMQNMYRHPMVTASMTRAQAVVTDLYQAFVADPALLPQDWGRAARESVPGPVARDYIAGMTDRYALAEYSRVFHTEIQL